MFDYSEYGIQNDPQPENPPSSFVRPLNLSDPHRRRSAATSRHSHTSHGSGLTYLTIPREGDQNPPEPIFGMPTPVIPLTAPLEDEEPQRSDYMMVDADPEYQGDQENDMHLQGGRRGFVGGFVSGLRRLPRVMLKNPRAAESVDRKGHLHRGSTEGMAENMDALPRYQPFSLASQPRLDPLSVQIVQSMDMHTSHPSVSVTSPSIRASRDLDQTLAEYSDRHHSHPNTHDGGTTLIHQSQINVRSPVDVEPLPASDYDKMSSILQATPSVSIASHINHIHKFINDVNQLPWVSSRITADYVPEKNGRRGKGKKQTPKVTKTWYPAEKNDLDLLSNGTPEVGSIPIVTHRTEGRHRRALTDSATSPSGASRTIDSPSTNLSSPRYSVASEPSPPGRNLGHIRSSRHHPRRSHHHHQPTESLPPPQPQPQPAIYPYIASPQPLYVYGSPHSPLNLPQSGSLPGSPEKTQNPSAMPVYMIPIPPPVYQPMPMYPYPQHAAS